MPVDEVPRKRPEVRQRRGRTARARSTAHPRGLRAPRPARQRPPARRPHRWRTLDAFYRELRRCRTHCASRQFDEHHATGEHACDMRRGPHVCKPLCMSSGRQTHNLLNAAFTRAVRRR